MPARVLSLDLLRRRSAGARAPVHLQPPRTPGPLTAPAAVGPARGSCCAGRRASPGASHLRQRQRGAHGGRVGGGHARGDQQAPDRGLRRVPTRRLSATRVGPRLAARHRARPCSAALAPCGACRERNWATGLLGRLSCLFPARAQGRHASRPLLLISALTASPSLKLTAHPLLQHAAQKVDEYDSWKRRHDMMGPLTFEQFNDSKTLESVLIDPERCIAKVQSSQYAYAPCASIQLLPSI